MGWPLERCPRRTYRQAGYTNKLTRTFKSNYTIRVGGIKHSLCACSIKCSVTVFEQAHELTYRRESTCKRQLPYWRLRLVWHCCWMHPFLGICSVGGGVVILFLGSGNFLKSTRWNTCNWRSLFDINDHGKRWDSWAWIDRCLEYLYHYLCPQWIHHFGRISIPGGRQITCTRTRFLL